MTRPGCLFSLVALAWSLPAPAFAIQLHMGNEGIIVHQLGHLFFLFSMVGLMFTINIKHMNQQKGWRLIQYAALFFIFWNLDTLTAHFLDNQIEVVRIDTLSFTRMQVVTTSDSSLLAVVYYFLKLDHLWCVPAMAFLYKGLDRLLKDRTPRQGRSEG
ncbi:MAG: hypothetical protein K9K63_11910 [Desulfotignum sp.]|nr:hypothetical protein [Desulfotignum sp.]MCF8087043.1 hypothetical protein [Desulfotignum sp.]MCF8138003.1 hypothetical protein [Desulfotignum sp.]